MIRSWVTDYLYDGDEKVLLDSIASFATALPSDSSQQLLRLVERRVRRLTLRLSASTDCLSIEKNWSAASADSFSHCGLLATSHSAP